jgi:[ribosomal protein S5]-alanine N-acetyltransferase
MMVAKPCRIRGEIVPDLIDPDHILETQRLRLEPLTPQHAAYLFPVLSDPHIYTYIPDEPFPDPDALARRYDQLAVRRSPSGMELWLNWAVQRKHEHDYIGTLQATVSAKQHATIAYLLTPASWGKGYAQEGCRRLLTLLFAVYRVEAVRAEVDTRNQASWKLLERLGFERLAFRQAADHFKGASSDEYAYELSKSLWQVGMQGGSST